MRVHVHTKFCFLCVLTFLLHQCSHCHEEGHNHGHSHGHSHGHNGHHLDDHNKVHSDLQISEAPYTKKATESPQAKSHHGDTLEEEQRYFIQQLFNRYGQKDKLDFQGFQSLLFSLGLGEVKIVEVDHENLGHDHVAHLDLLDMQDGLHSHSSTNDGHDEGHKHGHGHGHAHGHGHGHPHHNDHDHNDHDHDHNDLDHSGDDNDPNDIHQIHTGTDITTIPPQHAHTVKPEPTQSSQEILTSPALTESQTKKSRNPARVRGQRGQNKTHSLTNTSDNHDHKHGHGHGHGHGHHHSHSHKDKREAPGDPARPTLPDPILSEHPHQHEECLNLTQLLNYYGLSPQSLISPSQFAYLCPALLYQIDSRVCIRHHQVDVEQEALEAVSAVWVWVSGFVSITIISLLSLLGVVLVPILNQGCFKFLLTFLVALAVGTLSGDALLHLLPHSQGQHDHSKPHTKEVTDFVEEFDGVWKGLTALAGIYLLFIIEHCIGMFKHYKDQRGLKKANEEGMIGRKLSDHKLNRRSDAEWLHLKPLNEDPDTTVVFSDNGYNDTQLTDPHTPDSPTNKSPLALPPAVQEQQSPSKENGRKVKKHSHRHSHGHGHSHGGNCHSDQEMKDAGIASIAWMVIMGDGMHNFSDGLAIGAAFSANLTGGISTSVAVFCHELPHELGDFAVLLKAGMSVKQAIVYNLLSALMAYVGMLIGTAVGQYTHSITNWIFAITAGMFLYVALVDMLPEMLHGDSEDHKRCQLGHFALQNLGMLTGFSIMLLIAIFEDQIVFDFGF